VPFFSEIVNRRTKKQHKNPRPVNTLLLQLPFFSEIVVSVGVSGRGKEAPLYFKI
jgi:hypothetical protein